MTKSGKYIAFGALVGAVVAGAPANATKYLVNYTASNVAASLTFETTETADLNGFFKVTGVSGKIGQATDLALVTPTGFTAVDNLFKPAGDYVTAGGVSFSAGGTTYNLVRSLGSRRVPGGIVQCTVVGNTSSCSALITDLTARIADDAPAAVPEAATWAMMVMGFGLIGGTVRYRRQTATISFG